jgi:5-methyltetrahydrofolate--homocysteine methyltransferase
MTTTLFHELRTDGGVVVGDGGTGTMLQRAGLARGECPELWNADRYHQLDVRRIVGRYLDAGARVVETNTFGCNKVRLPEGVRGRAAELNRTGAALARAEVESRVLRGGRRALVAGSIGPTGKLLAPLGDLSADAAREAFAEQAAALVAGGADFLLVETMTAIEELRAAIEGCRLAVPETPVAVTMSFGVNKRGAVRTLMGVSAKQLVQLVAELGVEWTGANCGNGPAESEVIATELVKAARPRGIHVMVQSNAGMPKMQPDGSCSYDATPEEMAAHAKRLVEIGVEYVGGCCGTDPTHIRAIADALV